MDIFFKVPGLVLIKNHEVEHTVNYAGFGVLATHDQRAYQSTVKILEKQSGVINCAPNEKFPPTSETSRIKVEF